MKRTGYTDMYAERWMVDSVMKFNYDYVIIEDNINEEQLRKIDYAIETLERITGNGKLTLYKLRQE